MSLVFAPLLTVLAAATPLDVVIVPIGATTEASGVEKIVALIGEAVGSHYGLRPSTVDDLFSAAGTALSASIERCGADDECVRRQVRVYGADLGLIVLVNRTVAPPLVELTLTRAASRDDRITEIADLPDPARESEAIREKVQVILKRAGYVEAAQITVAVEPADSTVLVDEKVTDGLQRTTRFVVEAGPHVVELKRDGYIPQSFSRTLGPGERWPVEAKLVQQRSLVESPYFWGAVGVGAVVVTVVAVLIVRPATGLCLQSADGSEPC